VGFEQHLRIDYTSVAEAFDKADKTEIKGGAKLEIPLFLAIFGYAACRGGKWAKYQAQRHRYAG
jgi:hypothetical protein